MSRLAATLAESDLPPAARHCVLSLAAGSGPDNIAHMSYSRLASRVGLSPGHVAREMARPAVATYVVSIPVPGRANRWEFVLTGHSAGAGGGEDTPRAGAGGGTRGRMGGYAPAQYVSSNPSRELSSSGSPEAPEGARAPLSRAAQVIARDLEEANRRAENAR
jgi:hypothetical protein